MRVFYSETSPYARKVRMLVIEKGLENQIKFVTANALDDPAELLAVNPLAKIPALVTDSGETFFDSPLICEYLDSLKPEPCLIPAKGGAHWQVLKAQALTDGILDASVSTVMMTIRLKTEPPTYWLERWSNSIDRSLVAMEAQLEQLGEHFNLAHICYMTVLGYLDFRLPNIDWQQRHPALAAWCEQYAERRSYVETKPAV